MRVWFVSCLYAQTFMQFRYVHHPWLIRSPI